MKEFIKNLVVLVLSVIIGILVIQEIAYPTLLQYDRLAHVMNRFDYTKETLTIFVTLSIWLLYLQIHRRKLSMIYLYLFYSVYLFLLFVVLFTKAPEYHQVSLDLFDFISEDKKTIMEALLNVGYFIPLGALYAVKANYLELVVIALLTILGIETIQYAFYIGTFALSDILLNFIGCVIGYELSKFLQRKMQSPRR